MRQTSGTFFRLVKDYADRQGVIEQLKADKPLEWVRRINNIRNAVGREIKIYGIMVKRRGSQHG
ncbi:MAG: TnpV protein [Lachnospirales bacterium]